MRIQVFFSLPQVKLEDLEDQMVVVIDVLRSSTTICTALNNGVRSILPVVDSADAITMAERLGRQNIILGGEQDGLLIPGFDLGNSPAEYRAEVLQGKSLTFVSSNGTRAIIKAKSAACTVIAGLVNLSAVEGFLRNNADDITILCSGKADRFSIEDAVCAGLLTNRLLAVDAWKQAELNDAGHVAALLGIRYEQRLPELLRQCDHGRYLISIGMEDDLRLCAAVDAVPVIPVYKEDHIEKFMAAATDQFPLAHRD
ncbi:MAG: 2-phosphosulfolactate phosphatase [Candidatus Delongbacteria bacterium]|nr:2-phosphosulfolactate phosphatase [Candidatus Delongbacteria bacterium]